MIKEIRNIETNELTGYSYNGMHVPIDPNNRHYQEIQKLVKEGKETIEPAYTPEERLDYLKQNKKQEIKQALQQYLQILHLSNGVDIVNNLQEQTNNLNSLTLSQMAVKSPQWHASTNYNVNDVVYVNDVLLLCMSAGESGTTAPTPPTDFGVVVTDNTTSWAKLGFLVKTTEGRKYFTPQQIIQMTEEVTKIIHDALLKYNNIKEQIKQATTEDELNQITWSN